MIQIIGMGPGAENLITPAARDAVAGADILVGAAKWLDRFAGEGKELVPFNPVAAMIEMLRAKGGTARIAVLVSGDPGLYSLLGVINRDAPDIDITVVPGISAPQLLFARLGVDWSGVAMVSLHGRDLSELDRHVRPGARLCVLADERNSPANQGKRLQALGARGRAVIGSALSTDREEVVDTTIDKLAAGVYAGPAVVYLEIADE